MKTHTHLCRATGPAHYWSHATRVKDACGEPVDMICPHHLGKSKTQVWVKGKGWVEFEKGVRVAK
jgi:hypothetical protein